MPTLTPEHESSFSTRREEPISSKRALPRVLIGPLADDPTESVSCVNHAFVQGLKERYAFATLDATRKHGGTRQSMLNGINIFYFLQQTIRWLVQIIRHRPQLAHYAISSGWAMEKGLVFMKLARLFGAKTLGHLHSGEFIDHWRSLPPWRKNFAVREFARLDGFVLASQWWSDEMRKHIPLPVDRLFVVNNPIDAAFESAALQMPIRRSGNVVLSLGTMGRAKGVLDMLAAAEMIGRQVDFRMELAGGEREPNILREVNDYIAAHSLSETVFVRSSVSVEQKARFFAEASIFLLPSYYENFPLVLVEAAAAGMAVITTPVGAIPEFFQDGVSALFVEPGHPAQIAEALIRLVRNPDERVRLGQAARQMFLSRLARSRIMDSLDSAYRDVLA